MQTPKLQVIFDTNIFVSFALGSSKLKKLQEAWLDNAFTVVISSYLLAEIEDVLGRGKFSKYITAEETYKFLELVRALSKAVVPNQPFPEFSDEKDRYLLAMLRDNDASVLVTGDKKLLELERYADNLIINPHVFLNDYVSSDD